jgi:hypothetical protein
LGIKTGATYGKGYEDTGYFNRKYIPRKRSASAAGDLNLIILIITEPFVMLMY